MNMKLVPILLPVVSLAIGLGAGAYLRPADATMSEIPSSDKAPAADHSDAPKEGDHQPATSEYAKLPNQFVVPIVDRGSVAALVILSVSLEVTSGSAGVVFEREPRLRDEFLQFLFDHANTGGFDGSFTDADKMASLRAGLLEVARGVLGNIVTAILITDIVRQDG